MIKKLFIHRSLPEMYNIDVGDNNKIYTEVSGKKDGIPVIFIHGGPGGHCRSEHHSLFDPNIYKSVIFDQRGCGKSKPYRSLDGNNTENLVNDINEIWGLESGLILDGLYAGTADCIGIYNGEESLIDFKTAKKVKPKEWIEDYFLQCSAYANAHNVMYGTNIKQIVILMVDRNQEYKKFIVNNREFEHYTNKWKQRLIKFHNKSNK